MSLLDSAADRDRFNDTWENRLNNLILELIARWLEIVRDAVLSGSGAPDMSAWPRPSVWIDLVTDILDPAIRDLFDDATITGDTADTVDDYLATVHNRLRDFPTEAFEDVRDVMRTALATGATADEQRDYVASALGLDTATRRLRDEADDIKQRLDAGGLSRDERADLSAQRRELLDAAQRDEDRWSWRAARIARTEMIGASNAAIEAQAQDMADSGETVYRQWWATRDQRTRPAHRVAHGQTVPYGTPFRVGGDDMRFPGDPSGPASQVINCRCVMLILAGGEGPEAAESYARARADSDNESLTDGGDTMSIP